MELQKEIEVSKEFNVVVGFNPETNAVILNSSYEGKYGYSKSENGIKLLAILEEAATKSKNKWDDMAVDALEKLIAILKK